MERSANRGGRPSHHALDGIKRPTAIASWLARLAVVGTIRAVTVEDVTDRLYGLPLAEFTQARNEAAAELRKAGRRDAADEIKALRKPTASAAAANRLVREHRADVEGFLAAAAAVQDAQFGGQGDLASAIRRERELLARLVKLGGEDVRQTLQAAAVDGEAAKELLRGQLERELEPRGFGTLLAHAGPDAAGRKQAEPRPVPPKPKRPDDRATRARLNQAKGALAAARAGEREARRRWEHAKKDVDSAAGAVEQAQEELDRVHARS
jgi:hypothetical protein